jgi:hypothetical protein
MQSLQGHLLGMALKETPKKIYRASVSDICIDPASCRLCRSVGDLIHRKDIFKPSNRALLKIAEQLYGHNIAPDPILPVKYVDHVSADLKTVWSLRRSFQKHKRYSNNISRVMHELDDVLMSRRQFPDRQNLV